MFKCFLDLDGVLSDFITASHEHYQVSYSYDEYPYELGTWTNLPPETATGMTTRDFWDNLGADFWMNLPWMPDGKEILELVESLVPKEQICILTCPTLTPGCAEGKMWWIQQNLPDYARRFMIGPTKQFCAGPDTLLIDDADHNLEAFFDEGGRTVCVPRKWNVQYRDASRAVASVERTLRHELRTMGVTL